MYGEVLYATEQKKYFSYCVTNFHNSYSTRKIFYTAIVCAEKQFYADWAGLWISLQYAPSN